MMSEIYQYWHICALNVSLPPIFLCKRTSISKTFYVAVTVLKTSCVCHLIYTANPKIRIPVLFLKVCSEESLRDYSTKLISNEDFPICLNLIPLSFLTISFRKGNCKWAVLWMYWVTSTYHISADVRERTTKVSSWCEICHTALRMISAFRSTRELNFSIDFLQFH